MAKKSVLTPQTEDFPQWYQEVIAKADMAENGPVRGTMIIKPWGYAIWEHVQAELDRRIKDTGHVNAYFPLFIPNSFLQREAQHVEGFSPELAIVTHGGGSELGEPIAVRPTSETTIADAMSRWIQSHRDLPMLLNQWANVVRWELRPRLFLRTSEFLWQEGHTAHATRDEALDEAILMHGVYDDVATNVLSVPSVLGQKTPRERFAGADKTFTLEGMMRDTKALQMGTSHYLGTNFAEAFGIEFTDEDNVRRFCHMTSWGVSTRLIGALIMAHGDDNGMRLPPDVAPVQVVVMAIRDEVADRCAALVDELAATGLRVRLDADTHTPFGRRAVDWELKGVPVRLELGPRDLAADQVTMVRRDVRDKGTVPLAGAAQAVQDTLAGVAQSLLDQAKAWRVENTHDVGSPDEIRDRDGEGPGPGFFRVPWDAVGEAGEDALAERGFTVRCLTDADGGVPVQTEEVGDLVAWVGKAY